MTGTTRNPRSNALTALLGALCVVCSQTALGAAPQQAGPPAYYVKHDTWAATMLASRKALRKFEDLGLVVGLAEVIVVGQSYCGYTPVMAHLGNMLTMTTPRPDVIQPASLAEQQLPAPLFAVQQGTTSGWAHLGSLVVMDNSVVPGQFGITLRQEPCKYAANLGFVPADGLMDITGPPSGEYVPVRVSNDVIQLPLGTERPIELDPSANLGSLSVPTRQPPDFP